MRVSLVTQALACAIAFAAVLSAQDSIGSEVCVACHAEIGMSFAKNPHRAFQEAEACETCHGPGANHAGTAAAADIRNPAKMPPADSSALCLNCHRNAPSQSGLANNGHARNQVACVSCHPVHRSAGMVPTKPAAINEQCGSCHAPVKAAFARPYTHPLQQNAMSCVDCHDPHNRGVSPTSRMVAATGQPSCFNCHGEKRGPFVFEHAPLRTDGCAACHEPHGSANPRMLTRNQQRVVCLECHANLGAIGATAAPSLGGLPPAIHDLQNPRFQNCSTCHVAVHGSQVHPALLR